MKTMNRLQEIEQRLAAIRTECMNEGALIDDQSFAMLSLKTG